MPDNKTTDRNCPRCDETMQPVLIVNLPLLEPVINHDNAWLAFFCPACGQILHNGKMPIGFSAFLFDIGTDNTPVKP